MSVVRQNILANFIGKAWTALMSLAFVPLYIKFMSIEAYGLVGIFASLQALFGLLDLGFSTTLNKELARLSMFPNKAQEMRNLVRTLEVIYWGIGLAIALSVFVLASPIAHYWVKADALPRDTVQEALLIVGGIIGFQWPQRFYSGGLMGLQKQVILNTIDVSIVTLRGIGAVLILWQIAPTIQAFFTWQIFVSFVYTSIKAAYLWRYLPKTGHASHFQKSSLLKTWRFAAGLTGISVASLVVSQTDKIILSKVLPLKMFGYYTLARIVASSLYYFVGPIFSALFPRLSQLASLADQVKLGKLYHKGCQLISVIILTPAIVVALFSSEILFLWTGDPTIVANTHLLVSLLIIGNALNGLMYLPLGLQLSHGWTKLGLYSDSISAIVIGPMIWFLSIHYGAIGAAAAWILLHSAYFLICIPITHQRLLKGEQWQWYFNDTAMPLLAALTIALIWRISFPNDVPRYVIGISLAGISITTLITSLIVTPYTRLLTSQMLIKFKLSFIRNSIARNK